MFKISWKNYSNKIIKKKIASLLTFQAADLFKLDNSASSTKSRIIVTISSFIIIFIFLIIRIISVSHVGYTKTSNFPIKNNKYRREITDCNGKLLAVNLPSASLYVNPHKAVNLNNSINSLNKIIPGIDYKTLEAEIKNNKNFVWVKRDITNAQQEQIENLGLPGFYIEKEQKRFYPYNNLLVHVLGYVGRDLEGFAGIERAYNDILLNNSKGSLFSQSPTNSLKLSIDIRVQNILHEELTHTIEKFKALGGVGIIVNPKNGEILAMVSKQDFDPHSPGNALPEQLFNKASLSVNEIGSVFKALTIAIALDSGVTTLNDAYDITNMQVSNFQIKDYHPRKGFHSVPEIFLHSSNIGVGQMILETGSSEFKKYLKKLGLLDTLQTELLERATPLYPSGKDWADISLVTMSYGYGLSVSPLHFVQAMIPVVNGGMLHPLTFIKRNEGNPAVSKRIFKPETSKQMLKLMRLAVEKGTAKKAEVEGYYVGGKTGTANKASKRGYALDKRVSSFIGVLPACDPQFLIYIMLDEPKPIAETFGYATAGWTAAPTVGNILQRLAALYGLEPLSSEDEKVQELLNIQYKVQNEI